MSRNSFVMKPTKTNIGRYLLLIFAPSLLILASYVLLIENNVIPYNYIISVLILIAAIGLLALLSVLFFTKKQNTLTIKNHTITQTSMFGATTKIVKVKQIYYTKRNIFDELLLYDDMGQLLLCVCPHLENRFLFEEWLWDHNITS